MTPLDHAYAWYEKFGANAFADTLFDLLHDPDGILLKTSRSICFARRAKVGGAKALHVEFFAGDIASALRHLETEMPGVGIITFERNGDGRLRCYGINQLKRKANHG
ncbi:hypothetical protein OpiT1DRAFT_05428 [Opitutaceae bacterium TAV1]|nr:hypothetical protein OpiT1DRAFT_05428 [Opitutaceae bacterium TAV1]